MRTKTLTVMVFLVTSAAQQAFAAYSTSCFANKRLQEKDNSTLDNDSMLQLLRKTAPVWNTKFDANGRVLTYGIDQLFLPKPQQGNLLKAGESKCMNCHHHIEIKFGQWNPPDTACSAGDCAEMYATCGGCHAPSSNPYLSSVTLPYPDWLDFTSRDKLLRASYYRPGHTKAEASLIRARDGTMPPGSNVGPYNYDGVYGVTGQSPTGEYALGHRAHGWCDELANWMQAWIDAGYPEN